MMGGNWEDRYVDDLESKTVMMEDGEEEARKARQPRRI
jgi:hypothetical protein